MKQETDAYTQRQAHQLMPGKEGAEALFSLSRVQPEP
jgi:hypothetical protein